MSLSFSFSGINMILSIDISDKRLKVTPNGPYHIHGVTGFITVDSADNLPEVPIFGVIYQDLSTCDMFIPQCDGYRKLVADQIAMNGIFKTTTSENGRLMVSQILSRKYVGGNIAPPTYCDFSVESLEKLYTSDAATKHLIIVDGELRIWQNDHNYGLVLMNKLKLDKFVKGSSSKASSLGFSPTIVVNPEDLGFSKQSFMSDLIQESKLPTGTKIKISGFSGSSEPMFKESHNMVGTTKVAVPKTFIVDADVLTVGIRDQSAGISDEMAASQVAIRGITRFVQFKGLVSFPNRSTPGTLYQDTVSNFLYISDREHYRQLLLGPKFIRGLKIIRRLPSSGYSISEYGNPIYGIVDKIKDVESLTSSQEYIYVRLGFMFMRSNEYPNAEINRFKLGPWINISKMKDMMVNQAKDCTCLTSHDKIGFLKQSFSLDAGFTTSEPNSQSLTPNHQEGNNMPSIQGVNINFNLLQAVAETPKDDLSTFTADVDNGELAAAIRESLAADRKAKLASAAQEFVKVFRAAELTTAAAVEGIRAARRAEEQHRKTLNTIKRAQQYAIETNNALPLVCAMVNTTEHVVPAAWKPKNAKK